MKIKIPFLLLATLIFCLNTNLLNAQQPDSSSDNQNVYRPYSQRMRMEDSLNADTLKPELLQSDTVQMVDQYVLDSIAAREEFVRDSLLAREQFVRDSLIRRQEIIDSLNFLVRNLPNLIQASVSVLKDDIVLTSTTLEIIGDSTLNNFKYTSLPNRFNEPYKPWESTINLSTHPVEIEIDAKIDAITNIKAPGINDTYKYIGNKETIILTRQGMFTSKYSKKYYKAPVDSVFFDKANRISKVKRYYVIYEAKDNFQLGAVLFSFKWQVKQYTYTGETLSSLEIVKFCDRWEKVDPVKVCNISNYTITKQGYSFVVNRSNDPENVYSDGTYKYEFDNLYNLKNVTFRNTKNTENWKTFIELNENGYVSRYVYQENGIVNRTLLVNYYHSNPKAKYNVETVTCTFEDDGISYYQRNNTTEKSRVRDRLTGEWSDWE